jgi:RNA polymerase sigma factor (sigma-70 family)
MTETPLAPAAVNRADRSPDQSLALTALITSAAYGAAAAFEQLVRTLQPQVYRWALTFARDADDADEITQDTFIRVHRNLGQFRGESPVEAWVYGITRRVGLQRRRKSNRRKWLSESVIPGLDNVYNTDPGGRVDRQRIAVRSDSGACALVYGFSPRLSLPGATSFSCSWNSARKETQVRSIRQFPVRLSTRRGS